MLSHHQAPITGQVQAPNNTNNATMVKQRVVYGGAAVVGQPHHNHMASAAVGTPVMLPPPYVLPVAYPMAPPTMHH